tara:strand:+ start:8535 stop:9839 length:1305 start_codon:yes stop_codon:yes gene_type:complete
MSKIKNFLAVLFFSVLFFNLVFTRGFVGLEIFGYRIGEYVVLLGFLLLIALTSYFLITDSKKESRPISVILFYFIFQLIFTSANLLNTYSYKAGSFIGMISFYYVGLYFPHKNKNIQKLWLLFPALIPISYFFGSSIYPEFLINFFVSNSDKFEFIKASDILMVLLVVIFYFNTFHRERSIHFSLFVVIPIFLPILLYLSRGGFVALFLYLVMEMIYFRKDLTQHILKSLLYLVLGVVMFIASTLNIYGNLTFEKSNSLINAELERTGAEVLQDNLEDLLDRRNYKGVIFSLYFEGGTLKSTDGTLNWRLDIWQDLLIDMRNENKLIFGYGYDNILPVMTDLSEPGRLGADGMNENIHNYFFNVYARGGIPLLIMFLGLHYYFIKEWKNKHSNYRLAIFMIPLLLASFFDVTMEGVQFPLNYYFFIGSFLALKD